MNAASRLAGLLETALGARCPLRLRAWDGSEAGPEDAPTVVVNSRRAVRRLLWGRDDLALADAYVAGEITVDGDLGEALDAAWLGFGGPGFGGAGHGRRRGVRQAASALGDLAVLGALGPPPPSPRAARARPRGTLHSVDRDRAVVHHHYDVSPEFYTLLLDPTMAYSCGWWRNGSADDLAGAQRAKLDLVCRKLGLRPGHRLLDLGCGWGALALHAAERYGTNVRAVTLSAEQHRFVGQRVAERGLGDRVHVELRHYREVTGDGFDAVSVIEMGEHVGAERYPDFARRLAGLLRPGGRLLVQQMSRGTTAPGGGRFIETYIAPDMHMRPLGETVGLLEAGGCEVVDVHGMREDYARTIDAWRDRLERAWPEAVRLVGEPTARVWRLYLAGGSLAFARRRMGVDQILAVRHTADGRTGLPPTPAPWYGR